jgi:nucleoid-associated protein YgaU
MALYKPVKTSKTLSQFSEEGKFTTETTMSLMPDSRYTADASYRVVGVGQVFEGVYKFTKVTHTFSKRGYEVEVEALRTGGLSSAVPGKNTGNTKTLKEITHKVVRGDNLWDILEKYRKNPMKFQALANYNRIKNPHLIYPGQIVKIPANF